MGWRPRTARSSQDEGRALLRQADRRGAPEAGAVAAPFTLARPMPRSVPTEDARVRSDAQPVGGRAGPIFAPPNSVLGRRARPASSVPCVLDARRASGRTRPNQWLESRCTAADLTVVTGSDESVV